MIWNISKPSQLMILATYMLHYSKSNVSKVYLKFKSSHLQCETSLKIKVT